MGNLQLGSAGNEVKELQEILNKNGYNLTVDGSFGPDTFKAVRNYQQKNGLDVDGIVGTNTWNSLFGGSSNSTSSSSSTTGGSNTNKSTAIAAPTLNSLPTTPTYNATSWDDTTKGKEALENYNTAKDAVTGYGDFTYGNQEQLNALIDKILNREKFTYDLNGDALYQQYKDKYTQQAKMAMGDAIGQASAMTGGYGNSYAQSVGQQMYQKEMQNLNDIVPELYQMALDKYNTEGQDLYNQYGLLSDDYNREYGAWNDTYGRLMDALGIHQGDYYNGADMFYTEQNNRNNIASQQFNDAMSIWNAESDNAWRTAEWEEAARQYANEEAWKQKNWELTNEQWNWQKEQASASGSGGNGDNGDNGGNGGGGIYTDVLWNATGTYDDTGNPIFRNSEGKTQAFGKGVNPYTGTKHTDAKHGTFSNGYQPDNIGGTKLKNSGMSTNITGKNQTIWYANGKYWLWRGDLNKYIEVDVSDMDDSNGGSQGSSGLKTGGGSKTTVMAM